MSDARFQQHGETSPDLLAILALIQRNFAAMDSRIDPPSSMNRLTVDKIAAHCAQGEVWTVGQPPHGCIFLSPRADALYISKLAVDMHLRGQGLARAMVDLAEQRAKARGRAALELETRIALTENHAAFERMGFSKVAEGTHPGFDQPTFVVMRKPLVI